MARPRKTTPPSLLTIIRGATSYGSARTFLGVPLVATGSVLLLLTIWQMLSLQLLGAVGSFFGAMFFFSIAALGKALFDLADCAILAEARARAREAKEARDNYRASEPKY